MEANKLQDVGNDPKRHDAATMARFWASVQGGSAPAKPPAPAPAAADSSDDSSDDDSDSDDSSSEDSSSDSDDSSDDDSSDDGEPAAGSGPADTARVLEYAKVRSSLPPLPGC